MTYRLITACMALCALVLVSCGTAKKLDAANGQIATLQEENNALKSNVSTLQKQAGDLTAQNTALTSQFNTYKTQCEANEAKLQKVSGAMNELAENLAKLQQRVEAAAGEFQSKGLDVYSKDGLIYVNMQDNLMYKTGSAALSPDGKKTLANLATVLNEYPKLQVFVVGNTDTTHVKGVADNWSLSTERANGVVRVLVKEHQVDPSRLMAAGRGKFSPVADNSTKEGRAKNRRTEIILNPDWDRLWDSVTQQ